MACNTHNASMKKLLLAALLLLQSVAAGGASVLTPHGEASAATQDHARIRAVVADFVQQQTAMLPGKVTYQIDEIGRRIALSKCAEPEVFLPAGSQLIGRTSVGVRCLAPSKEEADGRSARTGGWSIFVPVQIRIGLNLLTSARQLPAGYTLQEQDIASQATESSRLEGFTDPKQVIGKSLRHGIAAGQILREDMLRLPYSITQGQVVPLVVQGSGFSIRNEGVALNNASEGQAVQVRVGSGRVISGVARGSMIEIAP